MHTIRLKDDYIKLGQALKAAGVVESGVDAKFAVQDGLVKVNKPRPREAKSWYPEIKWNMMARPS